MTPSPTLRTRDTHAVPSPGEYTNPAGERRTVISSRWVDGWKNYNNYTAILFVDHRKRVTLEGSPAEWDAWIHRDWTWGPVP